MQTGGGFKTGSGVSSGVVRQSLLAVPLGAIATVMAALASNGSYRKIYNKASLWSSGTAKKITATITGVAGQVAANSVTVIGTDAAGAPLTEVLPAFTLATLGTVTSVGLFKTVTQVLMPAHNGTGVLISVGVSGAGVADVLPAWTDKGVQSIHIIDSPSVIDNPVVPRNITATAGGIAGDIKAIQPKVFGTNSDDQPINETLPAFTLITAGSVVGSKAFKTVDSVEIPPHNGNGATTSFGVGAKLGIGRKLTRDTTVTAFLGNVKEGVAPTVVADGNVVENNTFQLASALNGSDVHLYFMTD